MVQQKQQKQQKSRSRKLPVLAASVAGVVTGAVATSAWGQCEPGWSEVFTPRIMSGGYEASATLFDDGSGMKLVVSGPTRFDDTERGLQVWDGQAWSTQPLPAEANGSAQIVQALNGNQPPRLVVTGEYASYTQDVFILESGQWHSTSFPAFEFSATTTCIEPGPNPALEEFYIGGLFYQGPHENVLVYRWDGSEWTPLDTTSSGACVADLVWFDDGTGMALYASVRDEIDGVDAAGVARWDGENWEEVGGGCPASWPSLEVHDDGSGLALWALSDNGKVLAKWNGESWASYPLEPDDDGVYSWRLTSASFGGEQQLAWISRRSTTSTLWRWDGVNGELIGTTESGPANTILAAEAEGGLIAAGSFIRIGGTPAASVARWDGQVWTPLGTAEVGNGAPGSRALLAVGTEGGDALGGRVFVAANNAGGEPVHSVATWDGSQWQAIGSDGNIEHTSVLAFAKGDLGEGLRVFAAGSVAIGEEILPAITSWDGTSWSIIGEGIRGGRTATLIYGSIAGGEPALFVGGSFETIQGEPSRAVAGLNADGWFSLSGGLPTDPADVMVDALEIHNDGTGAALYAGGYFHDLEPDLADGVLRWDGNSWSRVGPPLDVSIATVSALCSADLGNGRKLYAGGEFEGLNGELHNIAAWDGTAWLPLGDGLPFEIGLLTTLDTPEGPRLAATGPYPWEVVLWDGVSWSPFGADTGGMVRAITQATHEYNAVYLGGSFREVNGVPSEGIARWGCEECLPDFNSDGTLDTRDIVAFLNAWAAGDDSADFDGDGEIDTIDFIAFLGAWSAGC